MMKMKKFVKEIKKESKFDINKKVGNYELLNGDDIIDYVKELISKKLKENELCITRDGELCRRSCGGNWDDSRKEFNDYIVIYPDGTEKKSRHEVQERRIEHLALSIIQ